MLRGKFTFIRHEHNVGVSKKTDKPYDFASITLSDDIESFKLDLEQTAIPSLAGLRKGDSVNIEVEIGESFNQTAFKVVNVSLAKVISTEKAS